MGSSQRGFTLLELLVAIVIAGVLIGVATLSIGGFDRGLRFEADRLAQLLSLAREEALVRGAPIRLEADEERYRFAIWRDRRWQPILDDRDLRERLWERPTRVSVERPDTRNTVEFGRDQVDTPFALHLEREGDRVSIVSNGLGAFELRQETGK
ncbi:MAG: GspH/FimT family pseudopilin [Gammaproteobacteria bacterium]|nr:MAG: type II secretion system protein GspH [Lautropia sp. SCN 70-15]